MKSASLLAASLCLTLAACASRVDSGPASGQATPPGPVLLVAFENPTEAESAGRALTDCFATEITRRGRTLVVLPPKEPDQLGDIPPYEDEELKSFARTHHASAIVRGAVVEYRYKADLDGDPAVGVSIEMLDASARTVRWRATGSRAGVGPFSSLTATSQRLAHDITTKMPL